jgi:hypothetical protein
VLRGLLVPSINSNLHRAWTVSYHERTQKGAVSYSHGHNAVLRHRNCFTVNVYDNFILTRQSYCTSNTRSTKPSQRLLPLRIC